MNNNKLVVCVAGKGAWHASEGIASGVEHKGCGDSSCSICPARLPVHKCVQAQGWPPAGPAVAVGNKEQVGGLHA